MSDKHEINFKHIELKKKLSQNINIICQCMLALELKIIFNNISDKHNHIAAR